MRDTREEGRCGVGMSRELWECGAIGDHPAYGVSTDSREETVLGSIPLPSYVVAPVDPDDHISRKYAFKVSAHLVNEGLSGTSVNPDVHHTVDGLVLLHLNETWPFHT